MVVYEIVHIHPDSTEDLIKVVKTTEEIAAITEQPKYIGSWIRDDRKLLRWAKGEISIRQLERPMTISNKKVTYLGSLPLYWLKIEDGDELKIICLNGYTIVGYDDRKIPLWQTSSFNKLADLIGKDVAYQVQQYYEGYLNEFNVKGAM